MLNIVFACEQEQMFFELNKSSQMKSENYFEIEEEEEVQCQN